MDSAQLARLYDFSGKTIIVTGGTGILGREMACALVGCGANVAILGRNMDHAKHILDSMGPRVHQAIAVQADVVNQDSLRAAAETIKARFGTIYGLLNAAGGNKPQATTGPDLSFFDMPADAVRGVFDLNLMGTVLPTQVFGKMMAENGEGVILNVSSMSAIRPLTRVMAYSAAKAAVDSFTQWLAVHVARGYSAKIRVNAIAPGFFLTQQNKFILTDETSGQLTARGHSIIEHTPMGLGMPGPRVAAKSKLDPTAFFGMIEKVVAQYPHVKIVATTLREVASSSWHGWGAVAWIDGKTYLAPTVDLDVYDRVGGGDGFASGFFYGMLTGEEPEEAIKLGWAHGALLTTYPGDTTMATLEQVRAFAKGGSARIQR